MARLSKEIIYGTVIVLLGILCMSFCFFALQDVLTDEVYQSTLRRLSDKQLSFDEKFWDMWLGYDATSVYDTLKHHFLFFAPPLL